MAQVVPKDTSPNSPTVGAGRVHIEMMAMEAMAPVVAEAAEVIQAERLPRTTVETATRTATVPGTRAPTAGKRAGNSPS